MKFPAVLPQRSGEVRAVKVTVVSGMLGAGKTTFIQRYLRDSQERTVVLVNDFGKAGIDGEIFSAGGIESVELPSGCVCCTLKFDLITTVRRIVDTLSPDHLVIEPSGVAAPSGVMEALDGVLRGPVTVVGLIDATEFMELYESGMYGGFFEDQVSNADVVLINKSDIAPAELVASTMGAVQALNPHAIVFRTVRAEVSETLQAQAGEKRRASPRRAHFHFDTLSLKVKGGIARSSVERFFDELGRGKFGSVVRAKALVRTGEGAFRFDLSYGQVEALPFERDITDSRIVVIGERLDREGLKGAFRG
jgi:G3E family GTPase